MVDIDGSMEKALKVVRVSDGTETWTVVFLPCHIVKTREKEFVKECDQIIELYNDLENTKMKAKSHCNMGIVSFRLLKDFQCQE